MSKSFGDACWISTEWIQLWLLLMVATICFWLELNCLYTGELVPRSETRRACLKPILFVMSVGLSQQKLVLKTNTLLFGQKMAESLLVLKPVQPGT